VRIVEHEHAFALRIARPRRARPELDALADCEAMIDRGDARAVDEHLAGLDVALRHRPRDRRARLDERGQRHADLVDDPHVDIRKPMRFAPNCEADRRKNSIHVPYYGYVGVDA
jgi:hypothetical protein